MAATKQGVVLARADGRSMRGQAGEITFKIDAAVSGGAYSTWEYPVRPGGVSSPPIRDLLG
jgi:hypothetical protein